MFRIGQCEVGIASGATLKDNTCRNRNRGGWFVVFVFVCVMSKLQRKRAVVIGIMLAIGAIHFFRLGQYLSGRLYSYYYSCFSDVIVPFGAYFLLCLSESNIEKIPRPRRRYHGTRIEIYVSCPGAL